MKNTELSAKRTQQRDIELEYSYIDLQSPRAVSKNEEEKGDDGSSFTLLTSSMLTGIDERTTASIRSKPQSSSTLIRPSKFQLLSGADSIFADCARKDRLLQLFRNWAFQGSIPSTINTTLCYLCINDIYELSSKQLQQAVREYHQLDNFYRLQTNPTTSSSLSSSPAPLSTSSNPGVVYASFTSRATRQLAEKHERQRLQREVDDLLEQSEQLDEEIRLLAQNLAIDTQLLKTQQKDVIELLRRTEGRKGEGTVGAGAHDEEVEKEIEHSLHVLGSIYCENKLWKASLSSSKTSDGLLNRKRESIAPLFDLIRVKNARRVRDDTKCSSNTPSSSSSSAFLISTAKKLFSLPHNRDKRDEVSSQSRSLSHSMLTSSASSSSSSNADFAVINGQRLCVFPLRKERIGWEEINVAGSLYCSYLNIQIAILNSQTDASPSPSSPPSSSSSSSSSFLKCAESAKTFPRTRAALFALFVNHPRLRVYSSTLTELRAKFQGRDGLRGGVEMRAMPLYDRSVILLRQPQVVEEEILHLEGGVQATSEIHYYRAVLAVIAMSVLVILHHFEALLGESKGGRDAGGVDEGEEEKEEVIEALLRLFSSHKALETMALCALLDLPIGFESDATERGVSERQGETSAAQWLEELDEQAATSQSSEEIEWLLFRTRGGQHRVNGVADKEVAGVLEVRIQRIVFAMLRYDRLIRLSVEEEEKERLEASLNRLLVCAVSSVAALSSR